MNITRYNEIDFADMTPKMINEICTTYVPPKELQHCNRCGCITPNGGMCKECTNLSVVERNELNNERLIYQRTLKSMGKCTVCGKTRILRRGVCQICAFEVAEEKNRVAMREKYRKSKEYIINWHKKNPNKVKEHINRHKEKMEKIECQSSQTA